MAFLPDGLAFLVDGLEDEEHTRYVTWWLQLLAERRPQLRTELEALREGREGAALARLETALELVAEKAPGLEAPPADPVATAKERASVTKRLAVVRELVRAYGEE